MSHHLYIYIYNVYIYTHIYFSWGFLCSSDIIINLGRSQWSVTQLCPTSIPFQNGNCNSKVRLFSKATELSETTVIVTLPASIKLPTAADLSRSIKLMIKKYWICYSVGIGLTDNLVKVLSTVIQGLSTHRGWECPLSEDWTVYITNWRAISE